MKYSLARFDYSHAEQWQRDIFEQQLADFGFDSFIENEAYIPTSLLCQETLQKVIANFPEIPLINIENCPDNNWNATWEEEHQLIQLPMGMTIVPHCAFGAGYHETTHMMIDALLTQPILNKTVLDNGCGTGVLGIMAAKMGAKRVVAVDIDENCVRNTQENALCNNVELDVRLGDTPPPGEYDIILSNIHRNILIRQMPLYAQYINPNGEVWLSGFYEQDVDMLVKEAKHHKLTLIEQHQDGEWQMIKLKKSNEQQ